MHPLLRVVQLTCFRIIFSGQTYIIMKKSCCLLAASIALFLASCGPSADDVFPVAQGKLYGYINRTGKYVIDTQFIDANCFADGLALVAKPGDKAIWGYIDGTGKYVVSPAYSMATSFSEGIAFVVGDTTGPVAIDTKGAVKFTLPDAEKIENFHQGLAAYSVLTADGEKWGFIDKDGKTKIAPQFAEARFFSSGLCGVMDEARKWGFINHEGKMVIDFRFNNISPFDGNTAGVSVDGKWGVIDKAGKFVIEPQYFNLDLDGSRFLVNSGGKWGWISPDNKKLIDIQYHDAFPFHSGALAPVMPADKWGYVDKDGKMAISPRYDFAFGFDKDMAVVRLNEKYGFIDKEGKYVIESKFNEVGIDYYISRMTKNAAHFGVSSARNTPQHIAYKWLSSFYRFRFDDARKISTDETITLLGQFENLMGLMQDSVKQQMMQIRVGIKEYNENAGKPQIIYTTSDNPGKEEKLYLVRKDGKWLVQFTKNDGAADTPPAGDTQP